MSPPVGPASATKAIMPCGTTPAGLAPRCPRNAHDASPIAAANTSRETAAASTLPLAPPGSGRGNTDSSSGHSVGAGMRSACLNSSRRSVIAFLQQLTEPATGSCELHADGGHGRAEHVRHLLQRITGVVMQDDGRPLPCRQPCKNLF